MQSISVIIPAFNAEKYIEECLNSLIVQSYQNFEIIIVDDGSKDKTKEIIQSFIEKNCLYNVKYFYQENQGPASARNTGIKNSVGEFIVLLDADDFLEKDCLEIKINYFLNNPRIDFLSTNAYLFYSGKVKGFYRFINEKEIQNKLQVESLVMENTIITSTVMIRKSIFNFVGLFNESREIIGVEDFELWLRMSTAKIKSGFINLPLTYYREHSNSISVDKSEMLRKLIKVLNNFIKVNSQYENIVANQIKKINKIISLEVFKKRIVEKDYSNASKKIPFLLTNGNHFKKIFLKLLLIIFPDLYRAYFCKKFITREF